MNIWIRNKHTNAVIIHESNDELEILRVLNQYRENKDFYLDCLGNYSIWEGISLLLKCYCAGRVDADLVHFLIECVREEHAELLRAEDENDDLRKELEQIKKGVKTNE